LCLDPAEQLRGGLTVHVYPTKIDKADFELTTIEMPDGKLDQYPIVSNE